MKMLILMFESLKRKGLYVGDILYHANPFWPIKFLFEKSADSLMGVPST